MRFTETILGLIIPCTILFYFYALYQGACYTEKEIDVCPPKEKNYVMYNGTHCRYEILVPKVKPYLDSETVFVEFLEKEEKFLPSEKQTVTDFLHPYMGIIALCFIVIIVLFLGEVDFFRSSDSAIILLFCIPYLAGSFTLILFPYCKA